MIKTEIYLALRYLSIKKKSFFNLLTLGISVGGVALGVAALIITLAVMSGFQKEIREKILGFNPHLILFEPSDIDTLEKVKNMSGVAKAYQFVWGQLMLQSASSSSGAVLRGHDIPLYGINTLKDNEALIGVELAKALGVSEGEKVFAIVSPQAEFGFIPKIKEIKVARFLKTGMFEYDSSVVVMRLEPAQRLLGMGSSEVSGIGVTLKNPEHVESISKKIVAQIPSARFRTWQQLNRNLFEALKLEKIMMFIILTLIVVVAAFNIVSNLTLFVSQKSKDIGILKSLGMPSDRISRIFIFIGMLLGSIGIFLGAISGILVCIILRKYDIIRLPADIYFISRLPVNLNIADVSYVVIASFLITTLATVWPSYKAGRMNAAEILRYG